MFFPVRPAGTKKPGYRLLLQAVPRFESAQPILFVNRQVMRINVTLETVGELMMNLCTMGFAVTLLALGYFTMPLVACGTVEITVFCMICLQVLVDSTVT
jgi:hypothetical protein